MTDVSLTGDPEPDELKVDVAVLGAGVGLAVDRQRHFGRLHLPSARSDRLKRQKRLVDPVLAPREMS